MRRLRSIANAAKPATAAATEGVAQNGLHLWRGEYEREVLVCLTVVVGVLVLALWMIRVKHADYTDTTHRWSVICVTLQALFAVHCYGDVAFLHCAQIEWQPGLLAFHYCMQEMCLLRVFYCRHVTIGRFCDSLQERLISTASVSTSENLRVHNLRVFQVADFIVNWGSYSVVLVGIGFLIPNLLSKLIYTHGRCVSQYDYISASLITAADFVLTILSVLLFVFRFREFVRFTTGSRNVRAVDIEIYTTMKVCIGCSAVAALSTASAMLLYVVPIQTWVGLTPDLELYAVLQFSLTPLDTIINMICLLVMMGDTPLYDASHFKQRWDGVINSAVTAARFQKGSSENPLPGTSSCCMATNVLQSGTSLLKGVYFSSLQVEDFTVNAEADEDGQSKSFSCKIDLQIDFFVSHSWHDDPATKYRTLQTVVRAFEARFGREPVLWIDKFCIDQDNIAKSLAVLPVFISASRHMLVLYGETYLSRLWCCWELFVVTHSMGSGPGMHLIDGQSGSAQEAVEKTLAHLHKCKSRSVIFSTLNGRNSNISTFRKGFDQFDFNRCKCTLPKDRQQMIKTINAEVDGGVSHFNTSIRKSAMQLHVEV